MEVTVKELKTDRKLVICCDARWFDRASALSALLRGRFGLRFASHHIVGQLHQHNSLPSRLELSANDQSTNSCKVCPDVV